MLKLTKTHTAFLLLAGLVVGLAIPTLVADAQNRGNVYRVNRQSQWEQWRFPIGTLDIARNGSITPRQFRQRHNAAHERTRTRPLRCRYGHLGRCHARPHRQPILWCGWS